MTSTELDNTAPKPPASRGAEMWKVADAISRADIIPDHYRGKAANCFIAVDMAERMGVGVLEIMQNTYVVHGKLGFSATYVIGMANKSGVFRGPIQFDYTPGANASVTAWAVVDYTGEKVEFTVDIAMAKAEGWTKNTKYKTMPQTMLSYRAGSQLVKLYASHCLLGMKTQDELEDIHAAEKLPTALESVNAVLEGGEAEPSVAPDNPSVAELEPEPVTAPSSPSSSDKTRVEADLF